MTYEFWDAGSAAALLRLAQTHTIPELAAHFGRTERAVEHKLRRMGVYVGTGKAAPVAAKSQTPGRCTHDCPGGNRCCLRNDVGHQLHRCSEPACLCGTEQRYLAEKQTRRRHGDNAR